MCSILPCPKHYSTMCIFSSLFMCTFLATVQTHHKVFSKLFFFFFKGRRKQWNKGCLLSALDYIAAHFHLRVPRGHLAAPYTFQYLLLHKPFLLPLNNHQLSQNADLLTKQTLLNIAMCKCATIFLIAKNMSFLHSVVSRRDC